MKRYSNLVFKAVLVSSAMALSSYGQNPYQLTSGTSEAWVDVESSMGMYQWSLSGENQLQQQWFWYRVGSGQQYSIDTIGTPTVSRPSGMSTLSALYANSTLSVSVDYTLVHDDIYTAHIDESIMIHNNTLNPITLSFFQYSDFNLNGTANGDEIYVYPQGAYQTEGLTGIAEGVLLPNASLYEANLTGGIGSTLYRLQNDADVNLNNNGYAIGDVTWAFQWDLTIAGGATADIIKAKSAWSATIPEPSSLGLILLGMGLAGFARRRQ